MSNIRLFFPKSLSLNLTDKLDKSQSHYVSKVMRVKENEVFSLFNNSGEWEAKILNISKSIVEFNVTKQLRQKENSKELWLAFSPIKSNYFNFMIQKATELGVTKFLPILFDRTIVRKINRERLKKVIVEAAEHLPDGTVLDGELLAAHPNNLLPFSMLSKRASRKRAGKKIRTEIPAVFVAYDLLETQGNDIRQEPLSLRRRKLLTIVPSAFQRQPAPSGGPATPHYNPAASSDIRMFHSPLIDGHSWDELAVARQQARRRGVEGLMLKRITSSYAHGRPRGDWWKWKVEPLEIDAVLHYAQAGHGRRAGLHTDYTLGVWDGDQLVTVAKAYSGLSDKELIEIDKIIRSTTIERYGPVRVVRPTLVFQLAFENVSRSTRHKSGIAVRFPRIARWRRDKLPHEAATLSDLKALLAQATGEQ